MPSIYFTLTGALSLSLTNNYNTPTAALTHCSRAHNPVWRESVGKKTGFADYTLCRWLISNFISITWGIICSTNVYHYLWKTEIGPTNRETYKPSYNNISTNLHITTYQLSIFFTVVLIISEYPLQSVLCGYNATSHKCLIIVKSMIVFFDQVEQPLQFAKYW